MAAPILTWTAARPTPAALWIAFGVIVSAFGGIAILVAPGELGPPALPPELAAEPDLFIEDGVVTQYADDGQRRYVLRAHRITQFAPTHNTEARGEAALETLSLELPTADAVWRVSADSGRASQSGAAERIDLTDNVELSQDGAAADPRLFVDKLTVWPARREAESDQPVIIAVGDSRMSAAGLVADLASGRMRLISSTEQRVRLVTDTLSNAGAAPAFVPDAAHSGPSATAAGGRSP